MTNPGVRGRKRHKEEMNKTGFVAFQSC